MMRLWLPKLSGRELIAALLPVLFLLSACTAVPPEETLSAQPPATAPSEPLPTESAPTEVLYTDPFPEEPISHGLWGLFCPLMNLTVP